MFGKNVSAPMASPAMRAATPLSERFSAARQHVDQGRTRDLLQRVAIEGEFAVLPDQPRGVSANSRIAVGVAGGDGDVLAGERQHEQPEECVILNRRAGEGFMKGVGAQVANHFHALARNIGPWLRHGPDLVGRGLIGLGGLAFRLLRLWHPESDGLNLAFAIEIPAGAIGLARLAPDPLGLGRQLGLARLVHLDHRAALRQMIGYPLVLCAKESLHIGCVAAVLVGRREQVLDPCDAIGRS
jgi:hypothetical protein